MFKKYIADFYKTTTAFRSRLEELSAPWTLVYADQATYAINKAQERYILTSGLSTCVALVLYNEQTKLGMVAHFDCNNVPLSVRNIVQSLQIADTFDWQAHIIGGQTGWEDSLTIVNGLVLEMHILDIPIKSMDVLGEKMTRNIILDTADGKVYANELNIQNDSYVLNKIGLRHTVQGVRILKPSN